MNSLKDLMKLEGEIYKYDDLLKKENDIFSNNYNYISNILNQLIKEYEKSYKIIYNKYPKQFIKQFI